MVTSNASDRDLLWSSDDYVGQDVRYIQRERLQDASLLRAATWNAAQDFSGHKRDFVLRYISDFTRSGGPPRRAMDFWAVQEPGRGWGGRRRRKL